MINDVEFKTQGRNGYTAIDEYRDGQCYRTIDTFRTRKQAETVAYYLNEAFANGRVAGAKDAATHPELYQWANEKRITASAEHVCQDVAYGPCPRPECGVKR
jgi:hypothetical protein